MITIPSALLKLTDLDVGAEVELTVQRGRLVAQRPARPLKRYAIAELLEGSAAMKKLTAEVAWAREGTPVGYEIA